MPLHPLFRILQILISNLQVTDEGKEAEPARDTLGEGGAGAEQGGHAIESLGPNPCTKRTALGELFKLSGSIFISHMEIHWAHDSTVWVV